MPTIDADTHVDETEDTWEYMLPSEKHLKPVVGYPSNPDPHRPPVYYWIIDGERQPRLIRSDEKTKTTVEARELLDVKVRLRDMDALGVETHVIYPTMFLIQPTMKPETDLAIKRSYNRWLGHKSDESGERLRWVCLPPLMAGMGEAVNEVRWAKDHGCVGVLKKGDREAGKWPADPYFFPLYKEAEELDIPVCFHTGSGTFDRVPTREAPFAGPYRITLPVVHAYTSLVATKVPQQFPRLRFAFIEAGAGWLPYALYGLARRLARPGQQQPDGPGYEMRDNMLADNNLYGTCQVDEDLPYITSIVGEDNLLTGSDYTHADQSMERDFHDLLRARAEAGDITKQGVDKILYDNPKRLYGL
jgi:predicted TIM-barrel fold metal-dependent hydrolase